MGFNSYLPMTMSMLDLTLSELRPCHLCLFTDRHSYLRYDSFHPEHLKNYLVYSQALHVRCITSIDSEFFFQLMELVARHFEQDYPLSIIVHQFTKV